MVFQYKVQGRTRAEQGRAGKNKEEEREGTSIERTSKEEREGKGRSNNNNNNKQQQTTTNNNNNNNNKHDAVSQSP